MGVAGDDEELALHDDPLANFEMIVHISSPQIGQYFMRAQKVHVASSGMKSSEGGTSGVDAPQTAVTSEPG